MSPRKTWQERLWSQAAPDANGCMVWTGARTPNGYGVFTGPSGHPVAKATTAHRWSYYSTAGRIPDGMEIDHLCNVRLCINPDHLEAVTPAENMRRRSERQSHCKLGHVFSPENTHIRPDGARRCRKCSAAATARRRARKAVAA